MEIFFILSLLILFGITIGWFVQKDYIEGTISLVFFLVITTFLVLWLIQPREVEVIKPTTITTDSGIELNGYFRTHNQFRIIFNHITEIHITLPRWGSLNDETYEYKFTHTIEN
jgi:hypothetical protein